jgi:hypothetical protein
VKKLISMIVISVLIALTGCNMHEEGNEFIGKWQNDKFPTVNMVVEKNGSSYVIKYNSINASNGQPRLETFVGNMVDNTLSMNTPLGDYKLSIDKSTGKLFCITGNFTRVEP